MDRAGNMAGTVMFGRAGVDDHNAWLLGEQIGSQISGIGTKLQLMLKKSGGVSG